jgi:pimeloyl-ACP methyl ester carboxylesterase
VHGSGCNKTFYAWRLVDELLARGMAVLLFDLDGHGASPQVQHWPGTEQNVWAAVGYARARYLQVGLIGYSLGGCLAAHAVAHGLDVDALIVAEAPPRLQFDSRAVRREALALLHPSFWHVLRDSSLYHFVRAWGFTNIRCTIGTHDLIAALDLPRSLPRVAVPLLLVYGNNDAIVPLDQAQTVRECAPPHALFHEAQGASHLSLILDGGALAVIGVWLEQTLLSEVSSRSAAETVAKQPAQD